MQVCKIPSFVTCYLVLLAAVCQSDVDRCKYSYPVDVLTQHFHNICCHLQTEREGEHGKTRTQTMALVPYDENNDALAMFHKAERTFNFVEKQIKIKQDWNTLGVAAVVWDAAIVLCEYMEARHIELEKKNVIELGAGSGIVGIVANLLGAEVTITDRQVAIPYLKQVIAENINLLPSKKPTIAVLDWSENEQAFTEPFDIILGADIVYVEDLFTDLLRTIEKLSDEKTLIYLSCRIRYARDSNFLKMLTEKFELRKVHYDTDRDISIYRARKRRIVDNEYCVK